MEKPIQIIEDLKTEDFKEEVIENKLEEKEKY